MDLSPNDFAALRQLVTRIKPADFQEGMALVQLYDKLTDVLQQIQSAQQAQAQAAAGPTPEQG